MATYIELFGLRNDSTLRNKVAVAVMVAADTVRAEDSGTVNHAQREKWAASALQNPEATAKQAINAVLAANKDNTLAQINGATDVQIQTAVDDVVNVLASVV